MAVNKDFMQLVDIEGDSKECMAVLSCQKLGTSLQIENVVENIKLLAIDLSQFCFGRVFQRG
jgi:hypothetical protein